MTKRPSYTQLNVLRRVAHCEQTGRPWTIRNTNRTADAMLKAGWIEKDPAVKFERFTFTVAYRLTDAGRALIA